MNAFINKAGALRRPLNHKIVEPVMLVKPCKDTSAFQGRSMRPDSRTLDRQWRSGDVFWLDFGRHMTGYLQYSIFPVGGRQDAPAKLRFTFGEMPCEVSEPFENYSGWISSAWLQEELRFYDCLPITETLPRRYAFRYLKVEVLATSVRFGVRFESIVCDSVTSADENLLKAPAMDDKWNQIFAVSAATLRDCMQQVFEDGPKRDRRLWMGDLYLQALANYHTFHNDALVKRCLYLFAGTRDENGWVMASLYDGDKPVHDENRLIDYSLLYASTLYDYYKHAGDRQTAEELLEVAVDQIRLADRERDAEGCVSYEDGFTCFIDWHLELDKHAAAQGVFIRSAKDALRLCEELGAESNVSYLKTTIDDAVKAAMHRYWDEEQSRFVSGPDMQVSWASQIWMTLAGVVSGEQARELLLSCAHNPPAIPMITPYMVHYHIEALIAAGEIKSAADTMYDYWNGMAMRGADCFWEIWQPETPEISPYGHPMIHSYCHAWSCTPAYFLSEYKLGLVR